MSTVAEFEFAGKVTVAGTVATLVSDELRLTVRPPDGAGTESIRVRLPVPVPVIARVFGMKASVNVTWTG